MDDVIYDRPRDYDLEHQNDDEDVAFHFELARRLAPRRVLELGAGSGRVTLPLAELGARAFLYDKFAQQDHADRWLSDFESHVYFPRELELLYRQTGFSMEATYGDHRFRAPRASTRALVMVALKPA